MGIKMKSLFLILIFIVGCQSEPKKSKVILETGPQITTTIFGDQKVLGDTFLVSIKNGQIPSETYKNLMMGFLLDKGFKPAKEEKWASFVVDIYERYTPAFDGLSSQKEIEFDPDSESSVNQQIYSAEDGITRKWSASGKGSHFLALVFDAYQVEYGKRPVGIFTLVVQDYVDNWKKLNQAELLVRLQAELAKINITPVVMPINPKKPPGCVLRFGYELKQTIVGKKLQDLVDRVAPGSPAAKAGIKKGDRIIAIDSIPVSELTNQESEDIYLQKKRVPIKYERQGKIQRGDIQAQIMCERF